MRSVYDHNNSSGLVVQPELEVGKEGDEFEKEADEVAGSVMRMSSTGSGGDAGKLSSGNGIHSMGGSNGIKRMQQSSFTVNKMSTGNSGGIKVPSGVEQGIQQSKGGGQNLDGDVQQEMGEKIGSDFSHVKIHTSREAEKMNDEINAKAFTHGNDIYFNQNNYNPSSQEGKHLLAHELTHTVQQSNFIQPMVQRAVGPGKKIKKSLQSDSFKQDLLDYKITSFDNTRVARGIYEELNIPHPSKSNQLTILEATALSFSFAMLRERNNYIENANQQGLLDYEENGYKGKGDSDNEFNYNADLETSVLGNRGILHEMKVLDEMKPEEMTKKKWDILDIRREKQKLIDMVLFNPDMPLNDKEKLVYRMDNLYNVKNRVSLVTDVFNEAKQAQLTSTIQEQAKGFFKKMIEKGWIQQQNNKPVTVDDMGNSFLAAIGDKTDSEGLSKSSANPIGLGYFMYSNEHKDDGEFKTENTVTVLPLSNGTLDIRVSAFGFNEVPVYDNRGNLTPDTNNWNKYLKDETSKDDLLPRKKSDKEIPQNTEPTSVEIYKGPINKDNKIGEVQFRRDVSKVIKGKEFITTGLAKGGSAEIKLINLDPNIEINVRVIIGPKYTRDDEQEFQFATNGRLKEAEKRPNNVKVTFKPVDINTNVEAGLLFSSGSFTADENLVGKEVKRDLSALSKTMKAVDLEKILLSELSLDAFYNLTGGGVNPASEELLPNANIADKDKSGTTNRFDMQDYSEKQLEQSYGSTDIEGKFSKYRSAKAGADLGFKNFTEYTVDVAYKDEDEKILNVGDALMCHQENYSNNTEYGTNVLWNYTTTNLYDEATLLTYTPKEVEAFKKRAGIKSAIPVDSEEVLGTPVTSISAYTSPLGTNRKSAFHENYAGVGTETKKNFQPYEPSKQHDRRYNDILSGLRAAALLKYILFTRAKQLDAESTSPQRLGAGSWMSHLKKAIEDRKLFITVSMAGEFSDNKENKVVVNLADIPDPVFN